ncbi:MAG: hypothetical protein CSA65_00275 [Proteobacteria bacterium]|nr:MAG: hypothetical protein CSB49_06820 [Pseudomonadota bacterium]PIE19918.1 MAG: hypothetical protein CSA65_00275 [Pseudomonadota bacterium]
MSALLPDEFLSDFALPLIAGGELHVGRPLDVSDLTALAAEAASPGDVLVRVESLRLAHAQASWPTPVSTPLDGVSRRMLVGLHNTLFLGHPERERWTVRAARLEQLCAFIRWCFDVPPPRDEAELVARHTLLCNLPQLTRTDVEVRFWVGRRRFRGQTPPARLLRWGSLRRVQRLEEPVLWLADETLTREQRSLIEALFAASPLTALLTVTRPFPALRWRPFVAYLLRPRVCRALAYVYLQQGLDTTGPALARSFWELLTLASEESSQPERAAQRAVLRLLANLFYYLVVCSCLVESNEQSDATTIHDPMASLFGLVALCRRARVLPPPSRLGDEQTAHRVEQLLATTLEGLDGDDVEVLCRHLNQAL